MQTTTLGKGGPRVSRLGLGLMGMSGIYGAADETESIATIHAALEAGITLLDTGDFYGMGHNEMLLRQALREVDRGSVFIQVKFGGQRDPRGAFIGHDASPSAVKNSLAYTLQRLGTDYVDLYQPARLDPHVPIEDTVGAITEMIEAGFVRFLGLSEVGAGTIRPMRCIPSPRCRSSTP
jgi:aryl-alcohol dehydrogenase-like predicted oxidoreductase